MRGSVSTSGRIPTQWEMEFHVKYPIKESLEKCKRKPNGNKKREETQGEGNTNGKCQNIKKKASKSDPKSHCKKLTLISLTRCKIM